MRLVWASVLAVAACYAPKPQAGAPCDPATASCPDGQTCVMQSGSFWCSTGPGDTIDAHTGSDDIPLIDAAIDATPANPDLDGDGVLNAADNCPTIANANQFNEDGDKFGDLCDPCPPVADNNPVDGDGDGVADACDPRPAMTGDVITLFEGFHGGVPTTGWFKRSTWTAAADSVSVDVHGGTGSRGSLTIATPGSANETVSTAVRVDALLATDDAAIGVVDVYDRATEHGLYCHVTQWFPAPVQTPLVLVDLHNGGPADAFEITPGQTYLIQQRRDGADFTCDGQNGAVTATTQLTSPIVAPATIEIGLRVVSAQATFRWLMVVSNP